ncbi:coiled-coil domain-containing protein 186-like isoform X2 [Liolophura sinensis]|uniref:coiled-coil domain-containing protein 186-like isoform X2 n=1 Tax=Liolophura sinensis TaxID=3198878 RepID=UPI0031583CEF
MSDSSRGRGGINEDPQPESNGASNQQDRDDVRDAGAYSQSEAWEGVAQGDRQTGVGDRCEGQGCSELPEGCGSQCLPQADVGVSSDTCTEGSGGPQGDTSRQSKLSVNNAGSQGASGDWLDSLLGNSDMETSGNLANSAEGSVDVIIVNRSEGNVEAVDDNPEGDVKAVSDNQEGTDRPEGNVDGFSDSPEGDFEAVAGSPEGNVEAVADSPEISVNEVTDRPEGNVDGVNDRPESSLNCVTNSPEDAIDDNLQAIGPEETEDSVEGLYREGCVGVVSNSSSNAESLAQLGSAEAERTEDDIYGGFSNIESGSDAQRGRECAEADNETRSWTQELEYNDSARCRLGTEDLPALSPGEANNTAVESDSQGAVHVNPEGNETLSESDPEENACDVNLCNDRAEADSSHQEFHSGDQPQASQHNSSVNEAGDAEAESVEALCVTSPNEQDEPSLQAEMGDVSPPQPPYCAGESVGQDGVFSNLNSSPIRGVASSAEGGDLMTETARRTPPPPLGDICHISGTLEAGEPGDEPEDSDVSRPDQPQLHVASETDLYAPECDRGHASAVQPVQNAPVIGVEDEVAPGEGEVQVSQVGVNPPEHSDAAVSLPPCQQVAFNINDVDLRADQLCSGISGSDLGEDFLRSADMLQSLTENRPASSERNGEAAETTDGERVSENRDEMTDSFLSQQQNQVASADASESDTNMQELPTLQASAIEACALQESKLTNDCIPHSSRDVYSEHSNSNNSSVESLSSWMQSEGETGHVSRQCESLQGSSVSSCVRDESGDDDLLTELDAELESNTASDDAVVKNGESGCAENVVITGNTEPVNGLKSLPAVAICELSEEKLRQLFGEMQNQLSKKDSIITKLQNDKSQQAEKMDYIVHERDTYLKQLQASRSKQQADDLYLPQIKELEYTISQQQNEIRGLKDKICSHDTAAKRAVMSLQNELKLRVDQVTKMYEDCRKEKDSMVIKYAQAEHKNIDLQRATEKAEGRLKEILREREVFLTKARQLKADYQRTCSELQTKTTEFSSVSKELEKHKELIASAEVRIKWAQNKMKAELEAHKETKKELEKSNARIKEAKEETEQIRRDCQAIIKTYQESEEMKSSTLDQRLKKKETELLLEKQEKTDQGEVYHAVLKELETLKVQYKDNFEELNTYKDKVRAQEAERLTNEETLTKFKDIIQSQKKENRELQTKIDKLFYIQSDFDRAQDTIKSLDADIRDLKLNNKELQAEIESCRKRESDLLDLTKTLTGKNALLQSENTALNGKVLKLSGDNQKKALEIQEFETRLKSLSDHLEEEIKSRKDETEKLKESLHAKTKASEDLGRQVEEQRDEMKTIKRKHANNIKDLTRQLQQARRKLESIDAKGEGKESLSMGSRTSSNGSLNTAQGDVNGGHAHPAAKVPVEAPQQEYPVIVEQVEIDRQVLIDRIVKLQKAHARKNEKIEFMEDHIKQLVGEVKKKKRIIQNYVLREESGALSTENMDLNKAELARRGGIMASVYSSHASDSHMNLELSLEINKKLQSVLEDTLLKNITLKENIDTLGEEIARLSQENRRLQLSIQGLS